jgi:hypothetical protein
MAKLGLREKNVTLEECLARDAGGAACGAGNTQAPYLCGREGGGCGRLDEGALLARAGAIARDYYFLGITEKMAETVDVLEARFPRFFAGAGALYAELPALNANREKRAPEAATVAALEAASRVDAALYEAAAARLDAAHAACVGRG